MFAVSGWDGSSCENGWREPGSADADDGGVGDGDCSARHHWKSVIHRGNQGRAAGCGSGTGFAVPSVDDSAGGLDVAGATYAAARLGDGCGSCGRGDDYALMPE